MTIELIIGIVLTFLFGLFGAIIYVERKSYKYYNRAYKLLSKKSYKDIDKDYAMCLLTYKEGKIKWYYGTNYFILYIDNKELVLTNTIATKLNPVSYYYYLRFKKWFKHNYPKLKQ